jgi:hypothetical protein
MGGVDDDDTASDGDALFRATFDDDVTGPMDSMS